MNSDCTFRVGKTHHICQDYAISGEIENGENYIFLSDGCSGAADTDVGSRILCLLASKNFKENNELEKQIFIPSARIISNLMGLNHFCLDATFISAFTKKDKITIEVFGDGVVALKFKKDDHLKLLSFDYAQNYPYFLNYKYDKNRLPGWLSIPNNTFSYKINILNKEGDILTNKLEDFPFFQKTKNDSYEFQPNSQGSFLYLDKKLLDFVAIMSDGVNSFYEIVKTESYKINKFLPFQNIVYQLLSFKNFNGKFVKRRINKFLKNCKKNNWYYIDDFSVGVIYLGD